MIFPELCSFKGQYDYMLEGTHFNIHGPRNVDDADSTCMHTDIISNFLRTQARPQQCISAK